MRDLGTQGGGAKAPAWNNASGGSTACAARACRMHALLSSLKAHLGVITLHGLTKILRPYFCRLNSAKKTKERAKTKSSWISPIFVNSGVFSLGKQARFTLNFCSGMPLRKIHELTFLWFGLPGPLLKVGLTKSAKVGSQIGEQGRLSFHHKDTENVHVTSPEMLCQSNLSGDTFSKEAPQNLLRTTLNVLRTFPLVWNFPLKVAANFLEHSFGAFIEKVSPSMPTSFMQSIVNYSENIKKKVQLQFSALRPLLSLSEWPRFGSVRLRLGMERFERFRFSVPAVPLRRVFLCVSAQFNREDGSGSGLIPGKRFRRFRFCVRFLRKRFRRFRFLVPGPPCFMQLRLPYFSCESFQYALAVRSMLGIIYSMQLQFWFVFKNWFPHTLFFFWGGEGNFGDQTVFQQQRIIWSSDRQKRAFQIENPKHAFSKQSVAFIAL